MNCRYCAFKLAELSKLALVNLLLVMLGSPLQVFAACAKDIVSERSLSAVLIYDPFQRFSQSRSLSLTLINNLNSNCEVLLVFDSLGDTTDLVSNRGGDSLGQRIVAAGSGSNLLMRDRKLDDVGIRVNIPQGSRKTQTFREQVFSGQFVRPGVYTRTVRISAADLTVANTNVLEEIRINFVVIVVPGVEVSIAGSNAQQGAVSKSYMVDFGDVETQPVIRRAYLRIRSNADYEVEFDSLFNGHMIHSSRILGDKIEYQLFMGNQYIDLTQPTTERITGTTPSQGSTSELRFELYPPAEIPAAGDYGDLLTVTVTPRL